MKALDWPVLLGQPALRTVHTFAQPHFSGVQGSQGFSLPIPLPGHVTQEDGEHLGVIGLGLSLAEHLQALDYVDLDFSV